jgi:hypothetical protein
MDVDTLIQEMLRALTACKALGSDDISRKCDESQFAHSESPNPLLSNDYQAVKSSHLHFPWNDLSTTSISNMTLAAYWLECCTQEHKVCQDFETKGHLPHRIIDIRNPQSPVLTLGSNREESYVTLSYKWGETDRYVTTTQNLEEHTWPGIPLDKLPQTFRDAIFVASSLGFRWLWLDALCICQDISQELVQQIHKMDVIFQASALTIFATNGDHANSGLKYMRDPRWMKPCKLKVKSTVDGQSVEESPYITLQFDEETNQILYTRGWYVIVRGELAPTLIISRVLQEQILAHRALMFEDRQIRWRCLCGTASESRPDLVSSKIRTFRDLGIPQVQDASIQYYSKGPDNFDHLRLYLQHKDPMPNGGPWGRNNHYYAWYEMVTNYNRRVLTYEADVLSALTGLEKAMIRTHECTYCGGLWKEDLQIGLLWYVQESSQAVNKASSPSWSWIARRGCKIRFLAGPSAHTLNEHEGITVLDVLTDGLEKSPSTITSKRLRLRGKVRQLAIDPERGIGRDEFLQYDSLSRSLIDACRVVRVRDIKTQDTLGHISFDCDPEIEHTCKIYCLLCTVHVKDGHRVCTCLALVPTDDMLREFRRIGLITLFESSWFGLSPSTENDESDVESDNTIFRETITVV